MKHNPLKQIWRQGKPVFGTWATMVRHPRFMKLLSVTGLDFVLIEMEHSDFSISEVANLCLMAREAGIVPIVRPAGSDSHDYTRPLDAGAMGLLLPNVETPEQLSRILHQTKYYPDGQRILNMRGPHTDYVRLSAPLAQTAELNAHTLTIAMAETRLGLDNLDRICAVPGLDAIMIGPDDLTQDLGVPGDMQHPLYQEAVEHVIATCDRHGVPWGFSCQDLAAAERWIARGIRWMPFSNDVNALFNTFSQAAAGLHRLAPREETA
ncbi:aldolase [Bordetella parapertussis]|uniref:Aldolase n=4 Tax=Bordetella TaxID=517 RepID=K0MBM4_BORPB|nr:MULTISPECIES: aldolase/citrate lyase family protein [Bordetella]KAK68580.1 HpcH/HpaI aldolase/citrate lyase family protein [Bordetella bronchiseptica 980-2]AMG87938.1 aldolase [Bordetella bronchiseptica]AOB39273.1 aldolase [Bordetella parapertussis]AUL43268.1 aldolase [Bordetella parapertussis]AWP63215.1 aldolase [Bordetella parapertussis]